jgi:hydroxylamine reductase
MKKKSVSRRSFIKKSTVGIAASAFLPSFLSSSRLFAATETNQNEMFCYQCEQTMGGKGCTQTGVCGKNP